MSFLERFKDATIGFSGYPRLARDRASGFGYLALLLFLVLTISAVITTTRWKREMAFAAQELAKAPDFGVTGGEVYFEGPMPYKVEDPTSKALIIVDTTGQTSTDVLVGSNNGMLITKDKIYQMPPGGRLQTTDLKQLPISLHKQDVVGFLESLWVFVPVGYVFVYMFQLGFKALDAVILGLIGMLAFNNSGRQVPFQLSFKLGLYAMSLPIIIQWIVPGFTTIPFLPGGFTGFVVWWGLSILFVTMGLRAHFRSQDDAAQGVYPEE